ncbi:MAG: 2-dehydropantoate 2-reductase [Rubrivivax sp.]|nr:2-dehydropantoate 2-reductase [Rubrivivax sp.]
MSTPDSPFRHTVVVGAGAVGNFFGGMLARAGHAVTLIGRAPHVQAVQRDGLQMQLGASLGGRTETVRLQASTDLAAVREAELVLFCVKSPDTAAVAREMAPMLREGTLVLSLQNGVDNAETIARELGAAGATASRGVTVAPAVVYVATAMPGPGVVAHFGRGDLVVGPLTATDADDAAKAARLQALAHFFAAAGVPVRLSRDVLDELWSKLLVNSAYNAISALVQLPYGRMVEVPEVRALQRTIVEEVVAVAAAEGRRLPLAESMQAMERIATAMPAQFSSTAQDLARGKPTEIDHLNGHVARRGAALGVPAPVNQALHALVKLAEAARAGHGPAQA